MNVSNSKSEDKPDIYFPISVYNVDSIIPSEHDILYSTLCKTKISQMKGNKMVSTLFTCHAIFTSYGLAINMPNNFLSSSNKANLTYYPWHFISLNTRGISVGFEVDSILGARLKSPYFRLERTESLESKKEFNERKSRFIEKFRSLVIEKKKEMEDVIYKLLIDKPELRKKKKFKNYLPGEVSKKVYFRALRRVKGK